jgi:UDP-N-acetylglucosamine 2-epimerase (non-hydrolysing)
MKPTIDLVAGARPNFMKLAPVYRNLSEQGRVEARIVHTGQHYSPSMSTIFFRDLEIPEPEVHLEVGSGTHAEQTARILERYEANLLQNPPTAVVVFGDVNSTVACALAAIKLGIPVAHVEAGLRSFDRTMPEEINRVLTDAISSLFLVTEPSGVKNLQREGVADENIRLVGNVMIDTLLAHLPAARARHRAEDLELEPGKYGLVTLHRPSNVDDPATLRRLIDLLDELSEELPLVFPVHPRTAAAAEQADIGHKLRPGKPRCICLGPEPYLDHLSLMSDAAVVFTDSGGMQEETAVLKVPCLTLRENTERPVTIELGTSRLVGNDSERIRAAFQDALQGSWPRSQEIPLWDGRAGERVARELAEWLERGPTRSEKPFPDDHRVVFL